MKHLVAKLLLRHSVARTAGTAAIAKTEWVGMLLLQRVKNTITVQQLQQIGFLLQGLMTYPPPPPPEDDEEQEEPKPGTHCACHAATIDSVIG